MHKKILMAAAISGVTIGMASQSVAATWQTAFGASAVLAPKHSSQGLEGLAATATNGTTAVNLVKLGAEYAQNDLITFTLTGGVTRDNYAWPTSFVSHINGDNDQTSTGGEMDGAMSATQTTLTLTLIGAGTSALLTTTNASAILVGDVVQCESDTTRESTVVTVAATAVTLDAALGAICADNKNLITVRKAKATFGLVSSSSSAATYRVSAINVAGTNGASTVGVLVPTPAVQLRAAELQAAGTTGVSIGFSATTGAGTAMDALATGFTIASTVESMPLTITKFNGVVDVEASNAAFVGGTSTASSDVLSMLIAADPKANGLSLSTNATTGVITKADAVTAAAMAEEGLVHTITGTTGFNFLDTTAGTALIQGLSGVADAGTDSNFAVTETTSSAGVSLTVTDATAYGRGAGTEEITLVKTIAATTIPTQTFSGTTKYTWANAASVSGKTSTVTHAALGGFTLNGATITVYGVPMGSTVERMLWVTNKGSTSAALTASVELNGTTTSNLSLGNAAGNTTTSVDEALDTALAAAGVTPAANSRALVTLSAPIRSADMVVSASYKVTSANDRLGLETSDTIDDVLTTITASTGSDFDGSATASASATSK